MRDSNVRSFSFTMTGLTDRESDVVEKFLKHIVEIAEANGPQDIVRDGLPVLYMMLAASLPDYSAKEITGLALYTIGLMDEAIALHRSDGGRA